MSSQSDRSDAMAESYRIQAHGFRHVILFSLLIFAAVTVFSLLTGSGGSIACQIDGGYLGVGGVNSSVFLPLDGIQSVELIGSLEPGVDLSGESTKDVYSGTFHNDAYGDYQLFSYTGSKSFIVVRHAEGVLVFSDKQESATRSIYNALQDALAS